MSLGVHTHRRYADHSNGEGHPERPERILTLLDRLESRPDFTPLGGERLATDDELARVHTRDHIARVDASIGLERTVFDADTSAGPASATIARHAVGGTLDCVDAVLDGQVSSAFSLVRPPGHHAESGRPMGFCLFGHTAAGAAHAIASGKARRVAIIDWDVHHGNGTQEIFYSRNDVLVVSLHQHPLYPGTGAVRELGSNDGVGFTVNVPLPGGLGDEAYLDVFATIVEPVVTQFDPDLVMVAAGFDAHVDDPLGGMRVSSRGFGGLASSVVALAQDCCDGRVVACLEGGYSLSGLADSVDAVMDVLVGGAGQAAIQSGAAQPHVAETIRALRPYWNLG